MGTVFCGFGQAFPHYKETDPELKERTEIVTTGRRI